MHYYRHNVGDFALETRGLTYEQIGIYITLIDRYATTEAPITEAYLAVAYQEESRCLARALLDAFFAKQEDGWIHLRVRDLIDEFNLGIEKKRAAGAKGGRAKTSGSAKRPVAEGTKQALSTCLADAKVTINQEPLTNKEEVSKDTSLAKPARAPAKKGTQLTIEELPEDWRRYCEEEDPAIDPELVWLNFRDYWSAKGETKRDWEATWQSNVRSYRNAPEWKRNPVLKPGVREERYEPKFVRRELTQEERMREGYGL